MPKRSKPFPELTARQQKEFYKAWIRRKSCAWCGKARGVQASHHNYSTLGPSGTALKSSDYRCVPLCHKCHGYYHSKGSLSGMGAHDTRNFLMRVTMDNLVEFLERMLNTEEVF